MTVVKRVDLVLSGGGVKGVGLVGAIVGLLDAGYQPQRISGTSAGSIVGAIVAAAAHTGALTGSQVKELALQLDYRKFLDPGPVERVPLVGPSLALLRGSGIYRGDYAHEWVRRQLADLGVTTFADLAIDDDELPPEQRYRLVVTVADVTRGQLVRLPWDYRRVYGLDPDEQLVADAVRASMSIPFFFRPVSLTSSAGRTSTLVDGGLLSNFP
ncbi:MAG: patatin-like phospholipase family protein, partial [Myxococcota bacterium]